MARLPIYDNDQIARYLQLENSGDRTLDVHWAIRADGGRLTYRTTGLTPVGAALAERALAVYEAMTGIDFVRTTGAAQITFDDWDAGAYTATSYGADGIMQSARVNVSIAWLAGSGASFGTYGFQTYLHEIGHVLGLGHAGPYNDWASYVTDTLDPDFGFNSNIYLNDSWQSSIMSYFAPDENSFVGGQHNLLITPMAADLIALSAKYGGSPEVFAGDTVWGFNTNITTPGLRVLTSYAGRNAFLVVDGGGVDTLDFSGYAANQRIFLRPEAQSDVGGLTANMTIARGTIIENAVGGAGNDTITGGSFENALSGGLGNDRLAGRAGNDRLSGGDGNDYLLGEEGNDALDGGTGVDRAEGGTGNDFYRVDRPSDAVVESLRGVAGGSDTVLATVSYRLGANLEALVLGGSRAGNLTGNELANRLLGNAAGNVIAGRGGDDLLQGAGGADTMAGGTGADIFRYGASDSTPLARDRIVAGDGAAAFEGAGAAAGDRIDLSAIDADAETAGVQAFRLGGSRAVGHLWLSEEAGETVVSGNLRGSNAPEFELVIADGATLATAYTAVDFIGLA